MPDTVEILKAARELISDPSRWTTRALARDSAGHSAVACSDKAIRWCAFGALVKITGLSETCADTYLVKACEELYGIKAVGLINDQFGHADVMAMYDRAIQLAEAAHA